MNHKSGSQNKYERSFGMIIKIFKSFAQWKVDDIVLVAYLVWRHDCLCLYYSQPASHQFTQPAFWSEFSWESGTNDSLEKSLSCNWYLRLALVYVSGVLGCYFSHITVSLSRSLLRPFISYFVVSRKTFGFLFSFASIRIVYSMFIIGLVRFLMGSHSVLHFNFPWFE